MRPTEAVETQDGVSADESLGNFLKNAQHSTNITPKNVSIKPPLSPASLTPSSLFFILSLVLFLLHSWKDIDP